MALESFGGAASYDVTANTNQLDISDVLAEIIRPDNTILTSRIGISGFTAKQTTKRWNEDSLNPNTATATNDAAGTLDTSETSMTVASGHGGRFKVGTLFKDAAQGKTEVMQVTAVSTDTLTIVRGYGSTSGEAHSAAFSIMIIGHTKQDGWKPTQEDWTKERGAQYNYTQVFGRGLNISYTRRAIDNTAIPDEFAHQVAYRLQEISRELDSTVINSIRSASAGSDTVYRSMGGIIEFTSAAGGNTDATAENFTETIVNDMCESILNDGGVPNFILMSPSKKRTFSTFDQAYRRMSFDSKVAGYVVEQFISDTGFMLNAIVDPWIPNDVVVVGDINRIKIGPLQNDAMRVEELARTGRAYEAMVTGQYTAEFRNALEAFAIHTNLN